VVQVRRRHWQAAGLRLAQRPAVGYGLTAESETVFDAAIVGAGIAGLTAAYELTRRGRTVVVLEASARPGGLILTDRTDGFVIDAGPDALLVQKPAGVTLCRELGLETRLMPASAPRTAFVLWGGRLHPLPDGAPLGIPTEAGMLLRSRLFSPAGKLRIALERVLPGRTAAEDESLASLMRRRFGGELVTRLAEPLLAGIHAGDLEKLSARALFPMLVEAEAQHGSVARGLARRERAGEGLFRSLPGGLTEVVDALVARLPAGALRTGITVHRLERRDDGVTLSCAGAGSVRARRVILAVPAFVAAELVAPHDAGAAALFRTVRYLSSAAVAVAYRRDAVTHPLSGSGFVVPRVEPGCSLLAASWISSKWPGRAPAGWALLRAFVGGARDPDVLAAPDETLVRRVHDDLARIHAISGPPALARVYRWPRANPQLEPGHLARMAEADTRLARFGDVFVTGAGYRGVGLPDGIADARAIAARTAQIG
jgi:protoporphyrinogen/coproporphyrinogen III oxidase